MKEEKVVKEEMNTAMQTTPKQTMQEVPSAPGMPGMQYMPFMPMMPGTTQMHGMTAMPYASQPPIVCCPLLMNKQCPMLQGYANIPKTTMMTSLYPPASYMPNPYMPPNYTAPYGMGPYPYMGNHETDCQY